MTDPLLTIRLCGGVAVAIDGTAVDIGPAKCQIVLAALALAPGSPVSQRRLVELVWSTEPPATAERTLQSYVARLRKTLGPGSITRQGAAYVLAVPAAAVDLGRFQDQLDRGRVVDALAEWTGVPLDGLDAPGLLPQITALTERWLDAVETDLQQRLEVEPTTVVSELTELTAQHPFREQLWALLMTALYRSGRQADALATYRTAHEHLVEQLGLEPGPQLRELEHMILGQDERLAAPHVHNVVTARPRRGNAPRNPKRLIGRDQTLAAVRQAMESFPVVTLVGPGGIGKTSLAQAVAAQTDLADDAWIVELAEIRSDHHLLRAVADTLEFQHHEHATADTIARALAESSALLVLDNCEHVIQAAAELADAVVLHCPGVRVLATSRERLGLTNERVVTVEPLDPSTAAVELFNERAGALTRWFDADSSRRDVELICQRLGGIPLAIELAAARTTSLTPTQLQQRLDSHRGLRLLANPRTNSQRHATLQATIQWSYDLLTSAEQTVFRRLAVFATAFDLHAAEAVSADDDTIDALDVDRLLGGLVDQSMLSIELGPTGRGFRFLEPIHDFGLERLRESGHADEISNRHTSWCVGQIEEVGAELAGWGEISGVARLDELWPELRTAVDRAIGDHDGELVQRLLRPILGEIVLRSRHEIGDWVERLLEITPRDNEEMIVFGLYWAAHRYAIGQDPGGYLQLLDRYGEPDHVLMEHGRAFATSDHEAQARLSPSAGVELRRQGDRHLAERTDINLASALLNLGRYPEQETLTRDLVRRYREQGPPTYLNWSLMLLGYNALFRGRPDEADAYFNEAIDVDVPPRTHSPNRPIEARRAHRSGDRSEAYRILRGHISDILDTDNFQAGLLVCIEFVNMMVETDNHDAAARILDYLETTSLFDNPAWRTLVADASEAIEVAGPPPGPRLEHRDALELMASVLADMEAASDG